MEKLKPRLSELVTTLFRTIILIIETIFISLFTFLKFIKTTIQRINARIDDGKKFTPLMFWTFVIFMALPVFLAIFFPPPARSLNFEPFNTEVLYFEPKIPKNPQRYIEVNLPKEQLHGSATIKAVVKNNKQLVRKCTKVTSYNPHENQTDSTPCIAGGTGYNICDMARNGERVIALSQELITWSIHGKNGHFKAGDRIFLDSKNGDSRCNGEFIVSDAMNARYTNRADLFFLDKKDNTSCTADIYKILFQ